MTALWLIAALLTKHFIADFPLQFPRHYLNKGTYGHRGGIEHAAIHAGFTFLILIHVFPWAALFVSPIEGVAHYHIDWAKMNLNERYGWGPNNSEYFWWLLGFDQWLHGMTYVAIVWLVMA